MEVNTRAFGLIDIDDDKIIKFVYKIYHHIFIYVYSYVYKKKTISFNLLSFL